ncbi:cyclic nucleotide-binding domain-containing protein, partial [Myxococcota bacterium]|nr:cyclic nucleotide-binding domain-containing protein [Myxococcota bacterium]
FSRLSLEQLQRIDGLMCEEHFLRGEVVVGEGSAGEDLYVLMEGSVDFYKAWQAPSQRHLGRLQPVGYMGEIALLDDEPRSATAVALDDCRFLTLSGARFRELLLQSPEIAFEVFRVLTSRIRAAESQVQSMVEG